jgi:enamine deaminase RidA (YjgF/YER057c/UK114 family)
MTIEHLNPDGMHKSPAFSQAVIVPADVRTLVIGGQNGVDENGDVVGKGDIAAQTTRAVENLIKVLEAARADLDSLIRVGNYIREDADVAAGFEAWMAKAGQLSNPPAVSVLKVAGFAHPDFLIEIEATAVVK